MIPDSSYYGAVPVAQPSGDPGPMANPETTTAIRTAPLASKLPLLHQGGFWIVALIALAVGLIHISVRFS